MFELLTARSGRKAEAVAAARVGILAARAAGETPEGVAVGQGGGVVILTGRNLRERLLTDGDLRDWILEWAR